MYLYIYIYVNFVKRSYITKSNDIENHYYKRNGYNLSSNKEIIHIICLLYLGNKFLCKSRLY